MIKDIDDNRLTKSGITINEQNEIIISDENAFAGSFNNKNICSQICPCYEKRLPHERWGSCHVVTEGAAMQSIAETWQSKELQALTDEGIIFIFELISKFDCKINDLLSHRLRSIAE